jgi:hypothetical protein
MVILFTCYEHMKGRATIAGHPLSRWESTLYGGVSGGLAGFLTTPPDVIKTRIMTERSGVVPSMTEVAQTLYKQNGLRAFFTGAVPRSIWWFSVCSIFFPIYETSKAFLRQC